MLVMLTLAACGSGPEVKKVEVEKEAEPVAAEPAACVTSDPSNFEQQAFEDGVFRFCILEDCFSYDTRTEKLSRRVVEPVVPVEEKPAPTEMSGQGWKYEVEGGKLSVCAAADSCKVVKTPKGHTLHEGYAPSVSADGTMITATLSKEGDDKTINAYVWDVKSGKQLGKAKLGQESYICGGTEFIGNTVLVAMNVCAGPGGVAWFANPKGMKKIADLGPEDYGRYAPQYETLADGQYLFLEQGAGSLLIQDPATGKIVSHLDLSKEYPSFGEGADLSYEVPADGGMMWKLPDGRWVVALDSVLKLVVVDAAAANIVARYTIPRCAPAATP